ncbi:uroporphyrinogen decarboxylase family protein [Leadbettera azotonutricia]|uniref:Uroporphyrinogen decarboxylase (URO-D) domain-containing protein n=1 Tax=Leadbettera azotonutricia (strain ATCC BAA-888 / DSM 13862 / ZAS-9) TaxID=545695 RepID=F5YD55_LEAAZ|nr:uroporphyrinogen decarboxylase family protein [Leadbettera azotonutricia]AEF80682.1 hypothetical protein TREAZ_2757 [Leadbettera azotonutricia ZAS-9]
MTSKELVIKTLEFKNKSGRAPRQLWSLPWAGNHYPEELAAINRDFPGDFEGCNVTYKERAIGRGDQYEVGEFTDDWGSRFINVQKGVHGQVKEPIVPEADENWDDLSKVHFPTEWLSFDIEEANRLCKGNDKFVIAGCCPRPFEQLQFIRTSELLFIDLALKPAGFLKFIKKMHQFYCELLEKWAKTDVDALNMMDDWGTQRGLLIHPDTWVEIFKPLYKDYIDIAHRAGKKMFMHSDGHTLAIYPHLIELGLDAFNSQIFCMGVENLAPFKGKITFWGEVDRQHLLPEGTTKEIQDAIKKVHDTLWQDGGCIAQCEFGVGAKPENVRQVYASWDELTG